MTLDGFLTFLTLVAAIYALATPVGKLRARLGLAMPISVALLALALVLYLEFFQVLGQPCPATLGRACDWLIFPDDDSFTPPQLAFLVVLIWLAWVVYGYSVSQPRTRALPTLSRLVDNLVYEQRFAEVLKLVEPYLPLIGQAARRRLRLQSLHDHLAVMRSNGPALHYFIYDRDAFEHEKRRSSFSKKVRRWTGSLARLVPAQRRAETTAQDIARVLFRSEDLRRYIATMRPYFAIPLLRLEMHETRDFSEVYFGDLISDTGSVLYQELEQNQNISSQGEYNFPESNRLLHFLFTDARTAKSLEVWKPIGECLLKLLRLDESPGFVDSLNRREEGFDEERWKNPVWAGIFFFDLMVTAAAYQGVRWHMWLYYFPLFVERLEELYDTSSDPMVNTSDEFPTRSARLIYDVVSTLRRWVLLAPKLPTDSPHTRSEIFSHCQSRGWDSWASDNENIPVSAAITLGSCMGTIAMSKRLDDKFAGYMHEVVLRAIKDLGRDSEVGHLRSFLIQSIVHGGQSQRNHDYGRRLANLLPMADHVLRGNVDDYEAALKAAYCTE